MNALAITFTGLNAVALTPFTLRELNAGEVLVETVYTRSRLRLDDTPVSAGGEEWFSFQTDRPLVVAKPKILGFTASTVSPSSTRHSDNLVVSVP
ncbi:MAG: hypothetical protein WCL16_02790 [bacterium]